jgi:hypothetical protein
MVSSELIEFILKKKNEEEVIDPNNERISNQTFLRKSAAPHCNHLSFSLPHGTLNRVTIFSRSALK